MAGENETVFEFTAKDQVTPVVTGLVSALSRLNTALPQSDKALSQFEKSMATAATKAGLLGTAVAGNVAPLSRAQQALQNYQKVVNDFESKHGNNIRQNAAAGGRWQGAAGFISQRDVDEYLRAQNAIVAIQNQAQSKMAAAANAHNAAQLANIKNAGAQVTAQNAVASSLATVQSRASVLATTLANIPPASTRYALYDVSSSLLILGAALSAGAVAAVGFAASYERAFADVQRTVNDLNPTQLQNLNAELVELAATMPVTFQELAHIASLGGQLGINGSGIDEFTESVAMLATVSDLTVDKAATAFGRFKAILGVPEEEFDNLGSAILQVGVNSVATESQIVNITTQIASMAGFAGFTADQVVGLSGALASIGAPPELSRGVVTRLFATMSEAVAEGGLALGRFAELSGVSSAQFEKAWGTSEFSDVFIGFMRGIAGEGGNAVNTLHELGITSVRDVPLLMRLAGAADSNGKAFGLLRQTMDDANRGYKEGTLLAKQYEGIASTFVERLKVLGNNFANLAAAIGGPLLSALKPVLDAFIGLIGFLTDLASTPVGGTLFAVAAALAALTGGLLLFGSLASRAVAGMIAMQQASNGLFGSWTATRTALATMNAQLAATPGFAARAGVAARGLGAAFSTMLGPIGLALTALVAAPGIIEGVRQALADVGGTTQNTREKIEELGAAGNAAFVQGIQSWGAGAARFAADIGLPLYTANGIIKDLDKTIADNVNSGNVEEAVRQYNDLKDVWLNSGGNIDALNGLLKDSYPALQGAAEAAGAAGEGFVEMSEAEEASLKVLQDLQQTLTEATLSFINSGDLISQNQERQKAAAEALADAQNEAAGDSAASWQQFYDGYSVNLEQYLADLQTQVDAQNKWKENLATLGQKGVSQEILADLAKLGPEGAPLVQALVDGTAEQLQQYKTLWAQAGKDSAEAYAISMVATQIVLENAFKALGQDSQAAFLTALNNGMPLEQALQQWNLDAAGNPIKIHSNTQPAYDNTNSYMRWVASQRATIPVSISITNPGAVTGYLNSLGYSTTGPANTRINVGNFASGGYTGTGGKYQPAGIVHRGEFVVPSQVVDRIGLPSLYAMIGSTKGARSNTNYGYASGGYAGGGMDAGSMQQWMNAVVRAMENAHIVLRSDDKQLASTASSGDKQLAIQGSN